MPGRNLGQAQQQFGNRFSNLMGASRTAAVHEVDTLIAWLQAESTLTRIAAAVSLPWYQNSRAVEPLRSATQDPNPDVQRAAAWAFGSLEKTLGYLQRLK